MKDFDNKIKKFKNMRLITITCLQEKGFLLYYQFDNNGKIVFLEAKLPKRKPVINSISNMFPTAELYEREIHDFFGVEFKGNSRLHDKLFLPEKWKGKPVLLKDVMSAKYQEVK